MAKHEITIDYAGGKFSYTDRDGNDATTVEVDRKDRVEWRCAEPFAVLFKGDTPCTGGSGKGKMQGGAAGAAGKVKGKIRKDCQGNGTSYEYFVAAVVGGDVKTDDPAIIVKA